MSDSAAAGGDVEAGGGARRASRGPAADRNGADAGGGGAAAAVPAAVGGSGRPRHGLHAPSVSPKFIRYYSIWHAVKLVTIVSVLLAMSVPLRKRIDDYYGDDAVCTNCLDEAKADTSSRMWEFGRCSLRNGFKAVPYPPARTPLYPAIILTAPGAPPFALHRYDRTI
jgi:hypothetical protein